MIDKKLIELVTAEVIRQLQAAERMDCAPAQAATPTGMAAVDGVLPDLTTA